MQTGKQALTNVLILLMEWREAAGQMRKGMVNNATDYRNKSDLDIATI